MADEYKDDDADEAPKKPKKRAKKADEDEVCRVALERYGRGTSASATTPMPLTRI
jgi:hypothetical protein